MEIKFQTKEESKKQQREAFLKLSPADRFYAFLDLSERMQQFPSLADKDKNKGNFQIIIRRDARTVEK